MKNQNNLFYSSIDFRILLIWLKSNLPFKDAILFYCNYYNKNFSGASELIFTPLQVIAGVIEDWSAATNTQITEITYDTLIASVIPFTLRTFLEGEHTKINGSRFLPGDKNHPEITDYLDYKLNSTYSSGSSFDASFDDSFY